jgi:predicted small secreted protein
MKRTIIIAASVVMMATLITGCGSMTMPSFGSSNKAGTEAECDNLAKKLVQVDEFIVQIEGTHASQVGDLVVALSDTRFTRSTNKRTMLKDANKKKANYLQEQNTLQCKTK